LNANPTTPRSAARNPAAPGPDEQPHPEAGVGEGGVVGVGTLKLCGAEKPLESEEVSSASTRQE